MAYDYKQGKISMEEILNNSTSIEEKILPKDDSNFTYGNGIKSWIGSIFVDIIGSTQLIKNNNEVVVSKILRAFTSEIINIMNGSDNVREIGVRGDCVYGVFITPTKEEVYALADISFDINTLINMLNKLLTKKNFPTINVGIGVAIGEDLIIKAGKKGTGINDKIWIGNAVVDACNLANKAGRNGLNNIGFTSITYENFIEQLEKRNQGNPVRSWFNKDNYGNYFGNLIDINFNDWINQNL